MTKSEELKARLFALFEEFEIEPYSGWHDTWYLFGVDWDADELFEEYAEHKALANKTAEEWQQEKKRVVASGNQRLIHSFFDNYQRWAHGQRYVFNKESGTFGWERIGTSMVIDTQGTGLGEGDEDGSGSKGTAKDGG